jgi:hypothetical protein
VSPLTLEEFFVRGQVVSPLTLEEFFVRGQVVSPLTLEELFVRGQVVSPLTQSLVIRDSVPDLPFCRVHTVQLCTALLFSTLYCTLYYSVLYSTVLLHVQYLIAPPTSCYYTVHSTKLLRTPVRPT